MLLAGGYDFGMAGWTHEHISRWKNSLCAVLKNDERRRLIVVDSDSKIIKQCNLQYSSAVQSISCSISKNSILVCCQFKDAYSLIRLTDNGGIRPIIRRTEGILVDVAECDNVVYISDKTGWYTLRSDCDYGSLDHLSWYCGSRSGGCRFAVSENNATQTVYAIHNAGIISTDVFDDPFVNIKNRTYKIPTAIVPHRERAYDDKNMYALHWDPKIHRQNCGGRNHR